MVAAFAWPHFWVILIGSCLSTIGAGLQSLTGEFILLLLLYIKRTLFSADNFQ